VTLQDKKAISLYIAMFSVVMVTVLMFLGPKGCERHISSWRADAYGSDWLVVQYAQDGSVMNHWELTDKSVGSETNSDGIYFIDSDGNVVHLSGHYVYVEVADDWDSVKKRYLK